MNISTATPAQIDGEIARLSGVIGKANTDIVSAQDMLDRIEAAQGTYQANYPWFSDAKRVENEALLDSATTALMDAQRDMQPLSAEYTKRGGWTRFYLVTNTGGHIHFTTACGTCFSTTEFAWLTDYSGTSHADLVEEAGEMACTVCFPDAPVDTLSRKSRIKYESAEKKAKREEREAKKAAAEAAQILVEGYQGYGANRNGTKVFKTLRAATNDIAGNLASLCLYSMIHPSANEWVNDVEATRKAIADKGEAYDYDKALAAARKKVTKEGLAAKY